MGEMRIVFESRRVPKLSLEVWMCRDRVQPKIFLGCHAQSDLILQPDF